MTAPEWLARNTLPTPTSLCTVARAAEQFGHLLHERKSQAAAAVAPRDGRVRLAEAFENGGELVLGNANTGVGHLESRPSRAAVSATVRRNGRLHRILHVEHIEGRISTR